jgi:hypothetical protein
MRGPLTPYERGLIVLCALTYVYIAVLGIGAFWGGCHNPNSQNYYDYYSNHKDGALDGVRSFFLNVNAGIDQSHDTINAISAAAVAVFTVVLVFVTGRQARLTKISADAALISAKAARDSADALPKLERAYIFIDIDPRFAQGIEATIPSATTTSPTIKFQRINHGKTPAVIKAISVEFCHLTELPEEITYIPESVTHEIVVASGQIYPRPLDLEDHGKMGQLYYGVGSPRFTYFREHVTIRSPITFEDARNIKAGQRFLWFYGRVLYEDVFTEAHETRFCWRYDGRTNTFEPYNREGDDLNGRT